MTHICPICHSNVIKFEKVYDGDRWWSRCISGLDHGIIVFPDKTEADIGVDYEHIYFSDDLVSISGYPTFTIQYQELK